MDRTLEFDRKNTIVGHCSRKAATAHNKQFGMMAGVPTLDNFVYFCRLVAS
ncbi:MAG: hypothetical protein LBU83_04775 [Bacteroidales bacterium]|nr:hypothetical protein [Bacteroidales bacterium]